ncbi:MAG TPA: iron-sulfur cluster assembly accessory protein [Candidatus Poseidoniales archaeon]|nr:MAG TPA: iron-sulfur cluster assembly accessory protein [Candidatus Poseidoniales archaeon]
MVCLQGPMMLTISDKAHEMLLHYSAQAEEGDSLALRIEIVGRGPKGFQYDLQFIDINDAGDDDVAQEARGFQVRIAARSAKYLDGATLDFKETLMGGGFSFENPNPLWIDDLSQRVAEVIDKNVNPAVASHGGHVDLVGVDENKAIIAFGGGCQGCGMADVTLKQGVEVMIMDNVPEIVEVVDATDHAAGANPFY